MKGTAQNRLLTQVGRLLSQPLQSSSTTVHHLAGFFQENAKQFAVSIFVCHLQSGCSLYRCASLSRQYILLRLSCLRLREHGRLRDVFSGFLRLCRFPLRQHHRLHNLLHACLHHLRDGFLPLITGAHAHTPHQQFEFTLVFIELIQLARHVALVAEHVDQKPESTQTIAHFFKQYLLLCLGHIL